MLQIDHLDIKRNLPQSFDEMDKRMLHAWFKDVYSNFSLIFDKKGKVIEGKEQKAEQLYQNCMLILCDFNVEYVNHLAAILPVTNDDGTVELDDEGKPLVYCMLDYLLYKERVLDFMFGELTITNDPLPEKDGLINFGENFKNLRIDEYYFGDAKFTSFIKSKNTKELDLMLACFYRPAKVDYNSSAWDTDGDPREKFNEHIVEQRLSIIELWDEKDKTAALLYYISCRNNLQKQFPYLFQEGVNSSGAPLSLAESLITLCGGPFAYDKNRSTKVIQLFAGLSANVKKATNE